MTKKPTQAADQDAAVLIPAKLRVIVAGALQNRAMDYPEDSAIAKGLDALAAEIHETSVTGRAGHQDDLYNRIAAGTGVDRGSVKKVIHALLYQGQDVYVAPEGSNSPATAKAREVNQSVSKALKKK